MKIKEHFDGHFVVPDEPVPTDWQPNTPVLIEPTRARQEEIQAAGAALLRIASRARDLGFPADFSEQHDHYIHGTAER